MPYLGSWWLVSPHMMSLLYQVWRVKFILIKVLGCGGAFASACHSLIWFVKLHKPTIWPSSLFLPLKHTWKCELWLQSLQKLFCVCSNEVGRWLIWGNIGHNCQRVQRSLELYLLTSQYYYLCLSHDDSKQESYWSTNLKLEMPFKLIYWQLAYCPIYLFFVWTFHFLFYYIFVQCVYLL